MSLKKCPRAQMPGWDGPYYTAKLTELARAFDPRQARNYLHRRAKLIWGYVAEDIVSITTSDGYEWYGYLQFAAAQGRMPLMFPWAHDQSRQDDSSLDRLPALYTRGKVARVESITVINELIRKLK